MKFLFNRSFLLLFVFLMSISHAQDDAYYDETYYDDTYYDDAEYTDSEEEYSQEEYADAEYDEAVAEEIITDETETNEQTNNTPAPTSVQTVVIPVLQTYKPPIVVDPKNPALPSNHMIKRLRGTLWRGTERILNTNHNDVVQEMRMYIFFAEDTDAVGFRYMPYHSKRLPVEPIEYMNLNPLLQTNTYNRLESPSLKEFAPLSTSNKKVAFEIDNSAPGSQKDDMVEEVISETIVEIPEVDSENDPLEPIVDEAIQEAEATETTEALDEYEGEYYDDEYYADEYYSLNTELQQAIQSFVAQSLEQDQYIVNVGGKNSGIFIYKTRDPAKPYKVIFLSLEQGITLYALTIDNSFDVRDANSEAARQARELYLNILKNKINMAKYQRVLRPFESNSLY